MRPDSPIPVTLPRAPLRLVIAALVALIVAAYANSLAAPFVLDDRSAITENPTLAKLSDLGTVLMPTKITTSGRPLLNLSFAINHALGGENVVGYHLVNLAIHVLAALTLLGIVRRTWALVFPAEDAGRANLVAGLIAGIWAVHPLLTNAVTYLSQRAESMMGLFYLFTLYAFVRWVGPFSHRGWGVASVVACFAGMLTKEVMVTAPFVVLVFDRVFVARSFREIVSRRAIYYVALVLSWVVLVWLAVATRLDERSVATRAGAEWWYYALTEFKVVVLYVKLAFWPSPLVFDYGLEVWNPSVAAAAPYAVVVIAALVGTLWLFASGRTRAGFLAACYFVVLSPTSSFIPVVGQPMAESRLYLPLIPIVVFAVLGLFRFLRSAALTVSVVLAVVLAVSTFLRNADYGSAVRLWEDTVQKRPSNSRAQYNFANELVHTPGRSDEAITHYEEALRINPDLMEAHHNLANELAKRPGRESDALAHYAAALQLEPGLSEAHANAARLLEHMPGRFADAVAEWEKAVATKPDDPVLHFDLANALARIPGRLPEAIAQYGEALRLNPSYAEAHCNLANKLARDPSRVPEALAHYEEALRLKPDSIEAHFGYAARLAQIPGRMPEAATHFAEVVRLNPRLPEGQLNFARALASLGRFDEAVQHLDAVDALRPGDPQVADLRAAIRAAQRN